MPIAERDRAGDEDVEGDDDVGQYRTNGGNEVGHGRRQC